MPDGAKLEQVSSIEPKRLRSRSYQIEMYERSLGRNVIVAMDTGSGKTQVALMRIAMQLERSEEGKLVWFLAPTVALCKQQLNSIKSHVPHATVKSLLGEDGVDRWSDQCLWDAVLAGVDVVVSTHAVLAQALEHAFVTMGRLSLLIFDEAHHCTKQHYANQIMQVYHSCRLKDGGQRVPDILGLSATPIPSSKVTDLSRVESNLHAVSITPRIHRQDLLDHVHPPQIVRLDFYPRVSIDQQHIKPLVMLRELCSAVTRDPPNTTQTLSNGSFATTASIGQTPSLAKAGKQLSKFLLKATHVYEQLGPWAVTYFIDTSIRALQDAEAGLSDFLHASERHEKRYMMSLLRPLLGEISRPHDEESELLVSPKVERLIEYLVRQSSDDVSGLIFVDQRATVSALSALLSVHPQIKNRYRCVTFIGMSNWAGKKPSIGEIFDHRAQRETLTEFRTGSKNLIIATNALEEGIDVAACNLVICFDCPKTLRSFIQRRGRARKSKSTFALMFPLGDDQNLLHVWHSMEAELVKTYQADRESVQRLERLEVNPAEVSGRLTVESTGASLTPSGAMMHLYHFCAKLPQQRYVDNKPMFSFSDEDSQGCKVATVVLPNCLPSELRTITGLCAWPSERSAARDAAFQAYKAIYGAGLLNDNLLPLSNSWQDEVRGQSTTLPPKVGIPRYPASWSHLAESWHQPDIHMIPFEVSWDLSGTTTALYLVTPFPPPMLPELCLREAVHCRITFGSPMKVTTWSPGILQQLRITTHILDRSKHSDGKPDDRSDHIILFSPTADLNTLDAWNEAHAGRVDVSNIHAAKDLVGGVIRCLRRCGTPYVFCGRQHATTNPDGPEEVICARLRIGHCTRFMLDNDHSQGPPKSTPWSKHDNFPPQECTVDRLPLRYACFSFLMPFILQHVHIFAAADCVSKTIFKDLPTVALPNIAVALCAPSVGWSFDYERFEFFGDTVLKYVVSHELFCAFEHWHEGYLSAKRDMQVNNQTLAKKALELGLQDHVLTDPMRRKKWNPLFISGVAAAIDERRMVSPKRLADIVEALIGAAYECGGLTVALPYIHKVLPDIEDKLLDFPSYPNEVNVHSHLQHVERLVGREFLRKSILLEALTHASCESDQRTPSYQRLEFLGDAVLDMLVTARMVDTKESKTLTQGRMTLIKAAIVNGHLLGYLCMRYGVVTETTNIAEIGGVYRPVQEDGGRRTLWQYMRCNSRDIEDAQRACTARFEKMKSDIEHRISSGNDYPWKQLSRLHPDKFFSDVVESMIGAIYVDSGGDLNECDAFIERIGLVAYLNRMLEPTGLDLRHPRSRLAQLAGERKVTYNLRQDSAVEDGVQVYRYACTVSVDGGLVGTEVDDCLTKEEAIVTAADAVFRLLERRNAAILQE